MILSDSEIQDLAENHGMIDPYFPENVKFKEGINNSISSTPVLSFGQSSYGYDIRCADEFMVFRSPSQKLGSVVDPKDFDTDNLENVSGNGYVIIPPHSFVLGRSIERIKMPRDVISICMGKSTLARCGVIVNVTPLEPEWEGYITLEFSNTTSLPVKLYAEEGCAQLIFLRGNPCKTSYKDRCGKYQNQSDMVVNPKV